MKKVFAATLTGLLVVAVGCETKSPPGGPGATGRSAVTKASTASTGVTRTDAPGGSEATFKLGTPLTSTNLKQGEKKEVTITIDRGDAFKDNVQLKFETPKGLKVSPDNAAIKAGDKEVKVHVEADKDAPLGDHAITVNGTPDKGAATSVPLKITVDKGGETK
jgi:uncharacterized membrane protein